GLLVFDLAVPLLNAVIGVAVGEKQVEVAVVVVIEEFHSPAAHQPSGHADAGGHRHVIENFIVAVAVESVHFLVYVRYKQVHPTVLIVVRRVHAHAGAGAAVGAVPDVGLKADLLELSFAAVREEKVRHGVVGHKQVHPTVVVDIVRDNAPSLAGGFYDVGLARHFRKRAVAIIVEQPAWHGLVNARDAVIALAGLVVPAEFVLGLVEIYKAADEQVELPVVVVVEPDGARCPARRSNASLFRYIGEGSVAVVAVEDAFAVLCEVNVRKPVAGLDPDGYALAIAPPS